ncbi:hypothetical protein EJ08DRAFT_708776, partial [Tothia fuscella]
DPQTDVDFHGLKTLSRHLFDINTQLFDLPASVDLILSYSLLRSKVNVDGNKTDPNAFLTKVSLIKTLIFYLLSESEATLSLLATTPLLLPEPESSFQIGLILTRRLINMLPETTPPMYSAC